MKIHEYQAKQLLRDAGVKVPRGVVAETPEAVARAFQTLDRQLVLIKAQIHAGGRGKGTIKEFPQQQGVERVRSAEEAADVATRLLGQTLLTVQTGPDGQTVRRVLVEEGYIFDRELYLGIVIDRTTARPVMMASIQGGMDIERVATEAPERIVTEPFAPDSGLESFQTRKIARRLGMTRSGMQHFEPFAKRLARLFVELDCSLVEINPLALTESDELVALDAKMSFDDNSLFRHPELVKLRDDCEEDPAEIHATKEGLSYVRLDGNIGCLVNGAGLAMSTMDLITLHGGRPANFLDVGGGADVRQVTEAFRILLSDRNVRAVVVNIFGGIMRCSTIANAILQAYESVGFDVPLVVRLEGTEVEEGRRILAKSNLNILTADDLTDAALKVVDAGGAA